MPRISYSQCWEDPALVEDALGPLLEKDALVIASAGEIALTIASAGARVTAIDQNPAQIALAKLKAAAATLPKEERQTLLGACEGDRLALYAKVRDGLPTDARAYWDAHPRLIKQGVIHAGKLERHVALFRAFGLPLVHDKETIRAFLDSETLEAQRDFFMRRINTARYRFLLSLFSSRPFALHARGEGMYAYAPDAKSPFLERFATVCTSTRVKGNYFLSYLLRGVYGDTLPVYLAAPASAPSISFKVATLQVHLSAAPDASVDAFYLSDAFEGMSEEENEAAWEHLLRVARPGARVMYYNNLVTRRPPERLSEHFRDEAGLAASLSARNRVPIYGALLVHTLRP